MDTIVSAEAESLGLSSQRLARIDGWMDRLVAEGKLAGDILPPDETVAIMETLDEVRRQIGLKYPTE